MWSTGVSVGCQALRKCSQVWLFRLYGFCRLLVLSQILARPESTKVYGEYDFYDVIRCVTHTSRHDGTMIYGTINSPPI